MEDSTEQIRRKMVDEINTNPAGREILEKEYGKVWDTYELTGDFDVEGFMAPFVMVKRKSDNVTGTIKFQHQPRFYFSFMGD